MNTVPDVVRRRPPLVRLIRFHRELGRHSLLRCLEYERLETLGVTGRVLDFGGGEWSN